MDIGVARRLENGIRYPRTQSRQEFINGASEINSLVNYPYKSSPRPRRPRPTILIVAR